MRKVSKAASFLCAATMLAGSMPIMGTMPSVQAKNGEFQQITNDTFFKDKDGNFIYSQGGGIFEFDGKYYWYGVKYAEAVTYPEKSVALTEGESEYKLEHIPAGTYSIEASGDGVAIKMDDTAKDNTLAPIKAISTTGTVKGRVVTKQGKALIMDIMS